MSTLDPIPFPEPTEQPIHKFDPMTGRPLGVVEKGETVVMPASDMPVPAELTVQEIAPLFAVRDEDGTILATHVTQEAAEVDANARGLAKEPVYAVVSEVSHGERLVLVEIRIGEILRRIGLA